jgi:hypothetical protein
MNSRKLTSQWTLAAACLFKFLTNYLPLLHPYKMMSYHWRGHNTTIFHTNHRRWSFFHRCDELHPSTDPLFHSRAQKTRLPQRIGCRLGSTPTLLPPPWPWCDNSCQIWMCTYSRRVAVGNSWPVHAGDKMSMATPPGMEHRLSSKMLGHAHQHGIYTADGPVATCNGPGVPNLPPHQSALILRYIVNIPGCISFRDRCSFLNWKSCVRRLNISTYVQKVMKKLHVPYIIICTILGTSRHDQDQSINNS